MSLAFVGMSEAFGELGNSRVYPFLFFFLLFLLGASSMPGMVHILINSCIEFGVMPKTWRREIVAGTYMVDTISYEWEKIREIPSCAVGVPYLVVTVTTRCDWMGRTKTMGSHFNVTEYRTVSVLL
jgi:SNF family Na+-dependent transporter